MAKWHGYGRCKTRLSKDIGKSNSVKVQSVMTKHTISVAKFLQENKLIDISIAISGLGVNNCRRWSGELGIKKFNLQGKGCLGEKMKRQIIINKKFCIQHKIKNISQSPIEFLAPISSCKPRFLSLDLCTLAP